jgi:dolichol kinase
MTNNRQITYRSELLRKGIHLMSLSIPVMYALLPKETILWFLAPLTLIFVFLDLISHRSGVIRNLLLRYFGSMMRTHELQVDKVMLNGASYVLIAACLCVMVFPKMIAVTAFSILIVSDICAALIGRRYGSHSFLDKSLEGTFAFAASAVAVVMVIAELFSQSGAFLVAGIIGSLVGAFVENLSPRFRVDDNISIPFSIGITMYAIAALLGTSSFTQ